MEARCKAGSCPVHYMFSVSKNSKGQFYTKVKPELTVNLFRHFTNITLFSQVFLLIVPYRLNLFLKIALNGGLDNYPESANPT